ncbi:nuclear transport factor 2 family protein [Thalassotalea sp. M1531]|uniref:Nuclear transport factor 2 family protein n=1 Tax=Thalassotalea algicola TaxID=2716224 RepID=A0A7Y0LBJ2_9GAMM|nr:nuclear transport factor 2 family protein [Thalassotalea algicola]NMP30040.1 nuclear transport factor 2 family protein [Thalassotalea algicola]
MEQLRTLEVELHQFETRSNFSRIDQLIHTSFIEIGYSGTVYAKSDILESLLNEAKPTYIVWSQEYQFIELAENIVQVMYKEARLDAQGKLSRHSIRTSIWQKELGNWQVRFHQATPTSSFERLAT